jgi:hypothetical protein
MKVPTQKTYIVKPRTVIVRPTGPWDRKVSRVTCMLLACVTVQRQMMPSGEREKTENKPGLGKARP